MKPLAIVFGMLVVAALTATPAAAEGNRKKDKAAGAYCNSGKHVKDIAKCKETGGNK
jgi:hypothetical protein